MVFCEESSYQNVISFCSLDREIRQTQVKNNLEEFAKEVSLHLSVILKDFLRFGPGN